MRCCSRVMQIHHGPDPEMRQGGKQKSRSFGILAPACIRQPIFPRERPGQPRVVITALWFVAAGCVSCCVIKGTILNMRGLNVEKEMFQLVWEEESGYFLMLLVSKAPPDAQAAQLHQGQRPFFLQEQSAHRTAGWHQLHRPLAFLILHPNVRSKVNQQCHQLCTAIPGGCVQRGVQALAAVHICS